MAGGIAAGLTRIDRRCAAAEKTLVVLLLFTIILLGVIRILARNVLGTGFIWIDPLIKDCVLWTAFLGAALATADNRHIKIDLTHHFLPRGSVRSRISRAAQAFTLIICFVLFAAAVRYVSLMASDAVPSAIPGVQAWQLRCVIPYAFMMMGLRSLIPLLPGSSRTAGTGAKARP